jgi:hypothetical protein
VDFQFNFLHIWQDARKLISSLLESNVKILQSYQVKFFEKFSMYYGILKQDLAVQSSPKTFFHFILFCIRNGNFGVFFVKYNQEPLWIRRFLPSFHDGHGNPKDWTSTFSHFFNAFLP